METFEIFLANKSIEKETWSNLIKKISNYNKLRKWKLIIINDNNYIRYFIENKYNLPPTINNVNNILLRKFNNINKPKKDSTKLSLPLIDSNIVDIINYYKIKNKGNLIYFEISFRKLFDDKILTKATFYLIKNRKIKKYISLIINPLSILSVDFNNEKRYFYKSPPKYLDISKITHLLETDKNNALLKIDTFPYLQGNFYLNQNSFSFDKHSVIIGSSGSGKSKFISTLINNISKNKILKERYKIVVIDPHAALENDIGGLGKVIDFNYEMIKLFTNEFQDIVSETELLLDLFKSLITDYNSKLERVLRHAINILLINKSFNFQNLKKLILDLEYRNELIKSLKDELPISITNFFLTDFNDLKTKSYTEAISPIISFIDEIELMKIFNDDENYKDLKDTIKENFLSIFSLDRTKLGNTTTLTIAGLIMNELLNIIGKREIDKHIIFIIDEVAVVEHKILTRFLSESRKYNLSLILIGQYFNQISENLKSAIFANTINYYIFRVSKLDAQILVDNFNMKIPLNDSKEQKIKLLTELNNREVIVRCEIDGTLKPAFLGKTLDYKSLPKKKILKKEIANPKEETTKKQIKFKIENDINLKEILKLNSTKKGE